ncbi:PREDICTED: NADH dehydrogenase [ubiquinone] 1 beta subcomplex subunit 9-like [Papilio xuthus]|uniref:NADH dehydrogenase [ubiquinone] 1 beta subcomplex subunit 9 n=1 Tax=Papilio xuthus TaxID=66420 RepID=A0A0N1PF02_PAPXU|nr:PREDICTED: NADH dehydrogenase [ubiquinone] 1 beta subcomplex subunit 9-like [Papilio xuthus]KPJ04166.1 NADH dehydrogenase [ubiquinone] 1 beta subcomplex subunit 9 [Papilio xuthus]KPJ05919.1 NADH dehydrogenase [ubiquinone] 1 beta subcomplex subunit 9 [Papilio xuthus]
MNFAPELINHSQKVCALYKTALRLIESYYYPRYVIRYHQILLRKRFDDNKCVCDPKEQRRLLWVGEHEAFMKKNPVFLGRFSKSLGRAGGVAFERVVEPPDWVMDYWHPLEKAQYPQYFATRECRKNQFIKKWQAGIL